MPSLALTLSYNGAPFSGFARQPGQLTVQGDVEQALQMVYKRPIETVCAGRTDAGVHALGQVVSFDVGECELDEHPSRALMRSLNALTHDDISIRRAERMADGFSARFDAQSREYRYFLHTDSAESLVMRDFCWHVASDLDIEAMREGASHLIGEHDFKSFCLAASAVGKPTCRNVQRIDIDTCAVMGDEFICITIVGNAFLHSMVRTIVGTLVPVGKGKRTPEWVRSVLEAKNRCAAGENAPAKGLILWNVSYKKIQ